jgi:2-oxoisovalerate dehydrogenase E1 component alpha subunit
MQHLVKLGEWSEAQHKALIAELEEEVRAALKEAESHGTLHNSEEDVRNMFEDVFEKMPAHLQNQLDELRSVGA